MANKFAIAVCAAAILAAPVFASDFDAMKAGAGQLAVQVPMGSFASTGLKTSAAAPQGIPQIACYNKAMAMTYPNGVSMSFDDAISLCGGALSADEPLECYKKALPVLYPNGTGMIVDDAIKLCNGALYADATIACYNRALALSYPGGLRMRADDAIKLCGGTLSADAPALCYNKALAMAHPGGGKMRFDDAINLCRARSGMKQQ
ncbi:MAG: hypothetical protein PHP45_01730 [Elusimicrobiales bacterium]|nr:hypothetical protein [Elusimicrobiales bacterium]